MSVVLESARGCYWRGFGCVWKLSPSSCSCFIPNDSFCFPGYPLGGDYRSCRNRLMHALSGNIPCKLIELSNGESTWEVRKYRVWLGKDGQACSCRAYLNEGTCGHIDAAVNAAKQQGIIETKVRFTPTAKDRGLAALGSPSAQVRPTASGVSCLPFDAIAKKARDLVSTKKEEKKDEVGCFGLTSKGSSKEQSAPPVETLAIEDAPAVIVDAEKGSKNCGVEELIYLDGKEALDRAVTTMQMASCNLGYN